MLLANETVAEFLDGQRRARALPRARAAGPAEGGRSSRSSSSSLGLQPRRAACTRSGRATSRRCWSGFAGTPEERPIAFLMLRTMQKARYAPANLGHFGLAFAATRTSRRPSADTRTWSCTGCCGPRAGRPSPSARARGAARRTCRRSRATPPSGSGAPTKPSASCCSGRRSASWRDKVGEEFDGYITGVAAFGLFVELVEHFVEGLVHISTMADDYYRFLETTHTLRGENTRKVYRLGDRVRVQVVRVDMEQRQIELGLVEILDAADRAARTRPRAAPADAPDRSASRQDGSAERRRGASGRGPATAGVGAAEIGLTRDAHDSPHRHRHRRPHRSRQERARARPDGHRSRPPEGREGARHHHRSRLRALGDRRRSRRLRRRAGPRALRQEHARRRRRHRRRAAGRGGRRVGDAADARALRDLPAARRARRARRADEGRPRGRGDAGARRAWRCASSSAGSFLEGAPIVPVSSRTGAGLEALRRRAASTWRPGARPARPTAPARLPIDRVFSVKGFGTVVTGHAGVGAHRRGRRARRAARRAARQGARRAGARRARPARRWRGSAWP